MTDSQTPIDDDHFEYEGGMRQCISGFGENAKECVEQLLNNPYSDVAHNSINWHIDELVRWCRGLNRELKEKQIAANEAALKKAGGE